MRGVSSTGIWAALTKRSELCSFSGYPLRGLCQDHSSGHTNIFFFQRGYPWKLDDPKRKVEDCPISATHTVPGAPLLLENHACIAFPPYLSFCSSSPSPPHPHCGGKGFSPASCLRRVLFSYIPCVPRWMLGMTCPVRWGSSHLCCLISSRLVEITTAGSLCFSAF